MKNLIRSNRVAFLVAVAALLSASSLFAGDPVPGLDVKLGRNPGGQAYHVRTDASGNFTFKDLPAGEYIVTISQSDIDNMARTRGGASDAKSAVDFYLKLTDAKSAVNTRQAVTGVRITVTANGTVSGRVYRDAASGLPTGKSIQSPRDAASGMATGK
jgi:hypothetical protein